MTAVRRSTPRLRVRLSALLGLLLHLLMLGAAPLADARLDAASRGTRDHVESRREGPCAPAHDHAHCLFCLAMGQAGTIPDTPDAPAPAPDLHAARYRVPATVFFPPAHVSSLGSRAPPAA